MIVNCTGCQARFRVADEKIGPRGAKVRCSRCQTVFVVRREAPPAPPRLVDLELTPGPPRPARPPPPTDPFAAATSADPFAPLAGAAEPPPAPRPASVDPFAAAGLEAFGVPAPAPSPGRAAGRVVQLPRGAAPELAPAPVGEPMAPPGGPVAAPDPFALAGVPDPFGPPAAESTIGRNLPVTDLSQLLGAGPAQAAPAPVPEPEPEPEPEPAAPSFELPPGLGLPGEPALAAEGGAPPAEDGPSLDLGTGPSFDLGTPSFDVGAPAAAEAPAPFPADLALEERGTGPVGPPAAPGEAAAQLADPADVFAAVDPGGGGFEAGAMGGAAFEAGPLPPPMPGEEALSLATEPTPGPAAEEALAPAPARPPRAAPAPPPEPEPEPEPALRRPPPPGQRLRAAAVNALALVALLAVALAFRVVMRGDASAGPAAFRPSRLLRGIGERAEPAGPFELGEVHSALYEQPDGAVLYVRGEVVSRAPGPVGAVRVEAELVRDGQVLARGEGLAGAVPTAEDLYRATDRAALDALAAALRQRARRQVAPGARLAFLVTLGDAPADLAGATVRVRAAEDAGDGR